MVYAWRKTRIIIFFFVKYEHNRVSRARMTFDSWRQFGKRTYCVWCSIVRTLFFRCKFPPIFLVKIIGKSLLDFWVQLKSTMWSYTTIGYVNKLKLNEGGPPRTTIWRRKFHYSFSSFSTTIVSSLVLSLILLLITTTSGSPIYFSIIIELYPLSTKPIGSLADIHQLVHSRSA